MLPKLVHLRTGLSRRRIMLSVIGAAALLALPTFYGMAQPPEVKQRSGNILPPVSSNGDARGKPGSSVSVNASGQAELKASPPPAPQAGQVKPPSIEYLPKPTAGEQRIVKALEEKTAFDFEDMSLEDAMKQLSKQHDINIVFVMDHKVARDTKVTLRVRDVTLKNALRLILYLPLMNYIVSDEVLKIMPREEVDAQRVTRIYPVQDLVGQPEDFESLIQAIQQSVARGGWSTGQAGGPFGLGGGYGAGVGPSSPPGGISKVPASGSLVIHHNLLVHDEVLQLLRGLREAKSIPMAE